MNSAIVLGVVSRVPAQRILPSGDELISFDVTVERVGERSEVVPVVWIGKADSLRLPELDEEVLVFGRIRKRFFQTAVGLQSRTELLAERVVAARNRRAVARCATIVQKQLDELAA